jgi:4-hydroxybenzoate polyprenyltransferase
VLAGLWVFISERFPLKVTIPLTLVLFYASLFSARMPVLEVLLGWLSVFFALFSIRIADDLSDFDADKVHHPERALSLGRVTPGDLRRILAGSVLIIILLNIATWSLPGVVVTAGAIAYYALFFSRLKHRVPVVSRPLFSNVIFGVVSLYAGLLDEGITVSHWLLSIFIYTATIAHEWAHSAHGPEEGFQGLPSYPKIIGPRQSAVVACALFGLSGVLGWLFWMEHTRPVIFGLLLSLTSLHIIFLAVPLVRSPRRANARPFYVYGFTFFIFPLMGLCIESLIGKALS